MGSLLKAVRQYVRRYDLFEPGQAVVVGVSGGPDSLCLLHLLHALAGEMGLRLHVAHLHHGLRGAEADADAEFVAGFAAGLDLPCTIGRADVRALAADGGLSVEEAARQARYRFLADVARAVGAATIAVGHNADDQAETVLMHFLRGSGLSGLRGMLPKTPLGEYRLVTQASGLRTTQAGGLCYDEQPQASGLRTTQAGGLCCDEQSQAVGLRTTQAGGLCYDEQSQARGLPDVAQASGLRTTQAGGLCYDEQPQASDLPAVAQASGLRTTQAGGLCYIVRPLLAIPRRAIAAYCAEHGLQPRFDRSNEDTTFFR
ncbi:MAG: tRNA lysidine(34) synthetase TilS, partial [Anaerolineae bacterium]